AERSSLDNMKARLNPFTAQRIDALPYRFQKLTEKDVMDRLAALNYRAAITGPMGSGKTKLLEFIESYLRREGLPLRLLFLQRENPALPRDFLAQHGPKMVLLVDGADLLSRMDWIRLRWAARGQSGLIITSHRTGMLPTLVECAGTEPLLREIVQE